MLEQIIEIQGIGMLHDATSGRPLVLSKATAVYAENGRGKSALTCLLRSLKDNDVQEVLGRRALLQESEPFARLLIDGSEHSLAHGSWDRTYADLHVFDDRFVEGTVSAGKLIGARHLENLLSFALGADSGQTPDEIADTLADYRHGVNSRLRALSADFELATLEQVETGAAPRADYSLRFMGTEVPLVASDPALPSFSTTMSSGDRLLLGLAFFFCALDGDPAIAGKTVVFDDPCRGLDRRHKTLLAEAIMGLVGRVQLLVLSHDAEFIQMMRERGFDQVLQLARRGVYSTFEACDIDTILSTDYTDRFEEPEGFMSGGHPM